MINFNYQNTNERDIDRIICEELYCSQAFFNLFLSKVNRSGGTILNIEHSKRNAEGETDIEVIYLYEGNRYGMLIEDKIAAPKQDRQPERYRIRGEKGVKKGEYCHFDTFLVAPQRYINNPINDADKYDYVLSHDEIAHYFMSCKDQHSEFRMRCFNASLTKQQYSAHNMRSEKIDDFFIQYASYLEETEFDNIQIDKLPAGEQKPGWVRFASAIPDTYIMHKCKNKDKESPNKNAQSGFIDLRFTKLTEADLPELERMVNPIIEKNEKLCGKAKPQMAGKTHVVIRMKVSPIYNDQKLSDQKVRLLSCFQAISDMYELSKTIATIIR